MGLAAQFSTKPSIADNANLLDWTTCAEAFVHGRVFYAADARDKNVIAFSRSSGSTRLQLKTSALGHLTAHDPLCMHSFLRPSLSFPTSFCLLGEVPAYVPADSEEPACPMDSGEKNKAQMPLPRFLFSHVMVHVVGFCHSWFQVSRPPAAVFIFHVSRVESRSMSSVVVVRGSGRPFLRRPCCEALFQRQRPQPRPRNPGAFSANHHQCHV